MRLPQKNGNEPTVKECMPYSRHFWITLALFWAPGGAPGSSFGSLRPSFGLPGELRGALSDHLGPLLVSPGSSGELFSDSFGALLGAPALETGRGGHFWSPRTDLHTFLGALFGAETDPGPPERVFRGLARREGPMSCFLRKSDVCEHRVHFWPMLDI